MSIPGPQITDAVLSGRTGSSASNTGHLQGCICNSCSGMPREGTIQWKFDETRSNTNGSIQQLANYLNSGFSTETQWNLGSTGSTAKNGALTYNLSGFTNQLGWTDSNGISETWRALTRSAFDLYEGLLGVILQKPLVMMPI